jgi:hypothetical protein
MHTLMVIAGGVALLGLCLLIARSVGSGGNESIATAALVFIPLWLVAALLNMWVGVARAGYSIAAEAPIAAVVFGVPAGLAWLLQRKYARA